jgi:hypothetical protein
MTSPRPMIVHRQPNQNLMGSASRLPLRQGLQTASNSIIPTFRAALGAVPTVLFVPPMWHRY